MSGVSSSDLRDLQRDMLKAAKQAKILSESNAPIEARIKTLEDRQTTLYRRLRWLTLGR